MKFSMFSASFEAHPLLASFYIISCIKVFVKNFFSTFWGVFSVHFHASQCLVYDVVFVRACLPDSLIILPKIRPLVNAFFYLFFSFFAHPFLPLQLCPFQPFFVSVINAFLPYIFACILIKKLFSQYLYTYAILALYYLHIVYTLILPQSLLLTVLILRFNARFTIS